MNRKYGIYNYNGIPVDSATTKSAAIKRAKAYAEKSKMHMQVSWNDRLPIVGIRSFCKEIRYSGGVQFALNGTAIANKGKV